MKTLFQNLSYVLPVVGLSAISLLVSCVHTDQSGDQSSAKRIHFDKRDANGNGKLTQEEIAEYSHRQLLAQYDLNNDTFISPAEWKSAHPSQEDADTHFNRIDKNGDHKIAVDEAVLYVQEHVHYSNHFKDLDENDDNNLYFKEVAEAEPSFWNITIFSMKF